MSENDDSTPASYPAGEPSPEPPSAAVSGGNWIGRLPPQAKIAGGLVLAIGLALLFWPRSKAERRFEDGYLLNERGASVALAGELAPVTLVHFWATWCPPCRQEIPSLLAFADELGEARLKLVLVAVADEQDRAVQFVANARFPLYFDPVWDVARRFRTTQLPESHLILDGKLAASFVGAADWQETPTSVARRTVLARLAERQAAGQARQQGAPSGTPP